MSSKLQRLRLYWETIRHLRPVQIHGRAIFRFLRPKPDLRPAPPLRQIDPGGWVRPARRRPSMTGPDEFCFLNETHRLAQCGWDDPDLEKLWRYNLHYFDDLNAENAPTRTEWHRQILQQWIAENPPGAGSGWEPYPTSLRIVNWIKWQLAGNALSPQAVRSLAIQARWLERRLEWHLLGNHLLANAKALIFAGSFFDGPEPASWLARGLSILAAQLPEQILPDGGQFELSPMYHALALEDVLDLVNLLHAMPGSADTRTAMAQLKARIGPMRHWLATMCHPDGEIAFFNDAAFGIAPPLAELERYVAELGLPPQNPVSAACVNLRDSGYIRLQDRRAMALIDVARIGPDYLPGHAHADTLSFELSVDGLRFLVNSGTSIYGTGPERLRQRGTSAHNTVLVDGEDSSEVWSGFRVARRARPFGLSIENSGMETVIACSHDGYRRLPGKVTHRRTWRFGENSLTVEDRVSGRHDAAVALFHLHPDCTCQISPDGCSGSIKQDSTVIQWRIRNGSVRLQPSLWHPGYGHSLLSRRLELSLQEGAGAINFLWADR